MEFVIVRKGGSGSGNFGHAGRPGEVGGSGEGFHGSSGVNLQSIMKEGLKTVKGRALWFSTSRNVAIKFALSHVRDEVRSTNTREELHKEMSKKEIVLVTVNDIKAAGLHKFLPNGWENFPGFKYANLHRTYLATEQSAKISPKLFSKVEVYSVKDILKDNPKYESPGDRLNLSGVKPRRNVKEFKVGDKKFQGCIYFIVNVGNVDSKEGN
jgi:hypothetical protein